MFKTPGHAADLLSFGVIIVSTTNNDVMNSSRTANLASSFVRAQYVYILHPTSLAHVSGKIS